MPETPLKTKTKTAKVKTVEVKTVKVKTRTMPASQFKTHGLSVIAEVYNRREEVVITKYGKPMTRLVPLNDKPDSIFGFMQSKPKIVGDIVSPIFPEDN